MSIHNKIELTIGNIKITGKLNQSDIARKIKDILPLRSRVKRWGGELYFSLPSKIDIASEMTLKVRDGQLAYWPPGNAFCIFFGATPYSEDKTPIPSSEVCIIGDIDETLCDLFTVPDNAQIEVSLR